MFTTAKKKPGAPAARSGSAGLSFIGKEMVVTGDVASGSQLHVDGRIDGNVRCDTLVQGKDGTIAGNISAETVHLSGLVDGTVTARVVTLEPTARVTGDVTYETLSIAAGGAIDGRLRRQEGSGSGPTPEAIADKKRAKPVQPAKPETPSLLPHLDAAAPAPTPAAANG